MKFYRHICKNDKVYEDEAQEYAMDQLGITIKPIEKDGTYSQEQIDFMGEFTDWYFSGDWVLEEETEEIDPFEEHLRKERYLEDELYETNLDRKLGVL